MQKLEILSNWNVGPGQDSGCNIQWDGGKGWLFVKNGTFSGSSAKFSVKVRIFGIPGQDFVDLEPAALQNIASDGSYEFEAPNGEFRLSTQTLAGGDSIFIESVALVGL